jgi:hypothetical protein
VRLKFTKLSEEAKPKSFVWDGHEELEGFAEGEEGGRSASRSMRDPLQAFPSTRTDLLTVYTDQCGLQVFGVFFLNVRFSESLCIAAFDFSGLSTNSPPFSSLI